MDIFSNRLREQRDKMGLSQAKLANRIGVKTQTVSLWERGERYPTKPTLSRIADYFNVSIEYIIGESDDDSPRQEIIDMAKKLEVEQDLEELSMIFSRLCQLSPSMRKVVESTVFAAYKSDKDNRRLTPLEIYDFSIRSTYAFMKDESPIKNQNSLTEDDD